ncbi:hypothetical protein [Anaplasma phagocytophilum]|uniref:hypothetical protein n=1 Tax=Anaplasma phagocytophilum TaxID=948 RepID=UPI00201A5969
MCACLYGCNGNAFRVIWLAAFTFVNCNKLRPVKDGAPESTTGKGSIVPLLSDIGCS